MTTPNSDRATALAEALEKAGISSDAPEIAPNPYWGAQEAFYVCHGGRRAHEWRELRSRLTGPSVPRPAYHRKLADICHRALRRPYMPEDLRESVAYAWGYFDALIRENADSNDADEGLRKKEGVSS